MRTHTNHQVINGADGRPAFVVIPYEEYATLTDMSADMIPHEVLSKTVDGETPMKAWREHLGLTQAEIAKSIGVSQSSYAQTEASAAPRKSTREKVAKALGIKPEQLDF